MMPEQALMKMLIHTASDSCCIRRHDAQQGIVITRLRCAWCANQKRCLEQGTRWVLQQQPGKAGNVCQQLVSR